MNRSTLISSGAEVELICLRPKSGAIQVEFRAHQPFSFCPSCGLRSSRVHSHDWRTSADLPWEGIPVRILLQARQFFCGDDRCSRQIFTEQLPTTVARYARRSCFLVRLSARSRGRSAAEQMHGKRGTRVAGQRIDTTPGASQTIASAFVYLVASDRGL